MVVIYLTTYGNLFEIMRFINIVENCMVAILLGSENAHEGQNQVPREYNSGADPEIEEGGAYISNGDWCGARKMQLSVRPLASFPGLCAFVACSTSLKSLSTRQRI